MNQAARMSNPIIMQLGIKPSGQAQAPVLLRARAVKRGYCRPPLHSRFKPGQSGNPKGRPKQSRNLRTIVKQVLSEDMQIREGGRLRRMSAMEAVVRTIRARAFKGDPKALASLIVLARLCGLTESDEAIADLLHGPEYDAIIDDFLARNGIENAASDEAFNAPASPIATPAKREG